MTAVFNMIIKRHFEMKPGTTQKNMSYVSVLKGNSVGAIIALFSLSKFLSLQSCQFWCSKKNLQVEIDHCSSKDDLYIEKQQKKLYAPFF